MLGCRFLEKHGLPGLGGYLVPCETIRFSHAQDANLPLSVWALTMHAQEVLAAQDGFVWTHGTYQVRTLTTDHEDVPPLEGWARMWTQPTSREVCIAAVLSVTLKSLTRYEYLSFREIMVLQLVDASCERVRS